MIGNNLTAQNEKYIYVFDDIAGKGNSGMFELLSSE